MISYKEIKLEISKEEDYVPISEEEKNRISNKIFEEVRKLANRFDGCCSIVIEIRIEGKGNA